MSTPKDSAIVIALADLASQGVYKEVTPAGARNMNAIFELAAGLINRLETYEELCSEEGVCQEAAAQQSDDDEGEV